MTLSVSAGYETTEGVDVRIPLASDLAGFESARHNYYGSPRSRELGLELLPQLVDLMWLEVRGPELEQLKLEIAILLAQEPAGECGDFWRFRLENLRRAVDLAQAHGDTGYVLIG